MAEIMPKAICVCYISTKAVHTAQRSNIAKLCSGSVDFDFFLI